MSLYRWDPFADMALLREQVNRLFEQSMPQTARATAETSTWTPAVDILETPGALVVEVELTSVDRAQVDVQILGDTLTIKGLRTLPKAEGKQYLRIERPYGAFQRSFTLGMPVDAAKVAATFRHDGVLEITLPKREAMTPKQVKIEVRDEMQGEG